MERHHNFCFHNDDDILRSKEEKKANVLFSFSYEKEKKVFCCLIICWFFSVNDKLMTLFSADWFHLPEQRTENENNSNNIIQQTNNNKQKDNNERKREKNDESINAGNI